MTRSTRTGATVRQLDGKRLLGVARSHALVADRPATEGGTDSGFTSGELLLLAIGACCTGSLRSYLEAQGRSPRDLEVGVHFEAGGEEAVRDRIVITLKLDPRDYRTDPERIKAAATSGGVASRLMATSEVEVRFATDKRVKR